MAEVLKQALLGAGIWQLGTFRFASGEAANNKLDLPLALRDERARRVLLQHFAEYVEVAIGREGVGAIWGVPSGGQEIAEALVESPYLRNMELSPVRLVVRGKDSEGHKQFAFASDNDRDLVQSKRLIGIEDVTTTLGSIANVLALPELAGNTAAVIAGWRRGLPTEERDIGVPMEWLIEEHLPPIIHKDHPFYMRFGHLAVGKPL